MLLVIGFTGIASAQPPLTTDGQLEIKSLDITKSRDDVPGDHDGVGGFKKFDRFLSPSSGNTGASNYSTKIGVLQLSDFVIFNWATVLKFYCDSTIHPR
jgi:hypothetical protein